MLKLITEIAEVPELLVKDYSRFSRGYPRFKGDIDLEGAQFYL